MRNIFKVNDIEPAKYSKVEFDYSPAEYNPDGTMEERVIVKPVICSHFGCNRILNRTEAMGSNKCSKHQGKPLDVTEIIMGKY